MPEQHGQGGLIESLLSRDSRIVAIALALLFSIAGLYTVVGVGMNMTAIEMTRMARPIGKPMAMGAQPSWTAGYAVVVFLMWWVMMVAMMTPSAAPMVLLYGAVRRQRPVKSARPWLAALLLGGYLLAWAGFSVVATGLQWAVEFTGYANGAMMTLEGQVVAGLVLILAGLYQFTPLKSACLRHCRAPARFLAEQYRPGAFGAVALGLRHGGFCLGCCWALMTLLFVGGIMNMYWIAGLTAYVLIEKLAPRGDILAKLAGACLVAFGVSLVSLAVT